MKKLILLALVAFLPIVTAPSGVYAETEVRRILVENIAGGLVQVSVDGGENYRTVGRVQIPATTNTKGFEASKYLPPSTVAATATHGIRIGIANARGDAHMPGVPLMVSLVPFEFRSIPKRYGGHVPGSSGIQTDIHSGTSIFRNLAPHAGNRVYLSKNGEMEPLPDQYLPAKGDMLVIVVTMPENPIVSTVFENKSGGQVLVSYADGHRSILGRVVRPVSAVGRYDGTTYNGAGSINTNHGGVITISTAPKRSFDTVEGASPETRGGFMIQPIYHVREQNENKPQVMVIAADETERALLEGKPPLFFGNIPLTFYDDSLQASCRAEVKIDDGEWEAVPEIVGKVDNAFTPAYLSKLLGRKVNSGITAIRIIVPSFDAKLLEDTLQAETEKYNRYLISHNVKSVKGTVNIKAEKLRAGEIANFYVNGKKVYSGNINSGMYAWDTTKYPDAIHRLEIETPSGRETRRIFVLNNNKAH